jgi:hypothetical protein
MNGGMETSGPDRSAPTERFATGLAHSCLTCTQSTEAASSGGDARVRGRRELLTRKNISLVV